MKQSNFFLWEINNQLSLVSFSETDLIVVKSPCPILCDSSSNPGSFALICSWMNIVDFILCLFILCSSWKFVLFYDLNRSYLTISMCTFKLKMFKRCSARVRPRLKPERPGESDTATSLYDV